MPHTEGPWKWESLADGCEEEALVAIDGTVIVCRERNEDGDDVLYVRPWEKPLIAAAPEMYALLKEIGTCRNGPIKYCPACGRGLFEHHADDCRLAAVLRAVEGEPDAR
jgi:hypothetical protein